MLKKRSGIALVIMAFLATGSALAAQRPVRTEGVGGAYKAADTRSPHWGAIVASAEKLTDQMKHALAAAAEALRLTETVATGGGDVKIAPPTMKGVGSIE